MTSGHVSRPFRCVDARSDVKRRHRLAFPPGSEVSLVDSLADNLYSACYVRKTDNFSTAAAPAGRGSRLPVPARAPALPGAAGRRTRGPRAVRAGLRDPEPVRDQARAV